MGAIKQVTILDGVSVRYEILKGYSNCSCVVAASNQKAWWKQRLISKGVQAQTQAPVEPLRMIAVKVSFFTLRDASAFCQI